MLSLKSAAPLYLERRPSRTLMIFLTVTHGVGLLVLPWLALPWGLAWILGVGIIVSFCLNWRSHALLSGPRAIVQIVWDGQGVWHLRQRNDIEWTGELLPGYFAGPRLVLLSFVLGPWWRRTSVVLLPDNSESEALRRLRVRLRIARN